MANHYQILGIATDADAAAIKTAYRKLSKRYHPDITGDPQGHLFQLVNEAYEVLSNPSKRASYDRTLTDESGYDYRDNEDTPEENVPSTGSIRPAKVNWHSMDWFTKDWSGTKEKVVLPRNGMWKGILGGAGYVIGTAFLGLFSFAVIGLFPLFAVLLAGLAIFAWFRYITFNLGRGQFLLATAGFPAYSIFDLLTGLGKSSGPEPIGVVILVLALAGLYYLGIWSSKRWQYWQDTKDSRGSLIISAKDILEYDTWGKPGQLDEALGKFTERNIALGATGEKMTAELMNQLLRIPGTRIIHGLKFPGSENADVDHAIINGNKIVLVDSKMWAGGNYRWGYDGMIIRTDGSTSADLHTNFPYAVEQYRKDILEADIRGRILIHSNNGKPVKVDNSDAESSHVGKTRMCTAQEFFEETGAWFAEGNPGILHRGLINTLMYRLK
jgi:hypothetical protein